MHYKNIKLTCDDEFRLIRLKKVVDGLYNLIPVDYIHMIKKLEDIKGTLNIYWIESPSLFFKNIINSMWMDLYEFHTNHIILDKDDFCSCCNSPPQKEDKEIKEYLNSTIGNYNLNYII